MTRDDKNQFIHDLIYTVAASILTRVDDMPEEWDDFELRRYIVDKFAVASEWSLPIVHGYERGRRLMDYINECRARNL